jgi:trimeric autotransporter adhesin
VSPLTLQSLAHSESDAYAALGTQALTDLAEAQSTLATATADQTAATTEAARLSSAATALRRQMAQATLPSDVNALAAQLGDNLLAQRQTVFAGLQAGARVADAQAGVAAAQATQTWAAAQKASSDAALATATVREGRIAQEQAALGAPPLSTVGADATSVLGGSAFTAAQTRVEHDIPFDTLRTRAAARVARARALPDTALAGERSAEDQLAAAHHAAGGPDGELESLREQFTRADAAYSNCLGAAAELARVTQLLEAIPETAGLTPAEVAQIAAGQAAGEPAIAGEEARDTYDDARATAVTAWEDARIASLTTDPETDPDTVQAVIDAKAAIQPDVETPYVEALLALLAAQDALAAATATAIAKAEQAGETDPDVSGDPSVVAAQAEVTAATTAANTAADATHYSHDQRHALASWEAAIPDATWQMVSDFEDAQSSLGELAALHPGDLYTAMRTAEDAYATALAQRGQRLRAGQAIGGYVARRQATVTATLATQSTRIFSAARGDA